MKNQITKALAKGNYVRALTLCGYTISLRHYRANGRQETDVVVRSENGYEGQFASACEAWKAIGIQP